MTEGAVGFGKYVFARHGFDRSKPPLAGQHGGSNREPAFHLRRPRNLLGAAEIPMKYEAARSRFGRKTVQNQARGTPAMQRDDFAFRASALLQNISENGGLTVDGRAVIGRCVETNFANIGSPGKQLLEQRQLVFPCDSDLRMQP